MDEKEEQDERRTDELNVPEETSQSVTLIEGKFDIDDSHENEHKTGEAEISNTNSNSNETKIDKPVSTLSALTAFEQQSSKCSTSKMSERVKRKSWYNVIYPSYKSRSETFKKLFKDVPDDQRLIVDYSCALQREILAHGRLFVTQTYLCFHANIFGWETNLCLKWKDVKGITKEKTALVIPNAVLITTESDKYFLTSFAARDKTYLLLFRVWQNVLSDSPMRSQEIWQCVHKFYGDQLGLTSDDEDYCDPNTIEDNEVKQKDEQSNSGGGSSNTEKVSESDLSAEKVKKETPLISKSVVSPKSKSFKMSDIDSLRGGHENLMPTDLSDSTDSNDESKRPFVCTAECTSMHEGRTLVHTILPINVDNLMTLLFSKSKFFVEFHNMRKSTNIVYGDWIPQQEGIKTRSVNLTAAITQGVGPKSSHVTEAQVMQNCSEPGQLYSIDVTTTNSGIPYADSFAILTHFCLVRTVDDHTMLSVYVQIKYIKSVWGVVKGFIEKNIWAGLEDFYQALLKALQSEYCIPPAKSKSRRTKRALSQKNSIEDMGLKARLQQKTTPNTVQQVSTVFTQVTRDLDDSATISSSTAIQPKHSDNIYIFPIFVTILIIALVILNVTLLIQLYLTNRETVQRVSFNDLPNISGNDGNLRDKWVKLLKQQKFLHDAELDKWQQFINATVKLLQQIKSIYTTFNLELEKITKEARNEL